MLEERNISRRTMGAIAVIISAVCFGLVPMFVKILCNEGANSLSSAFYRSALSLLPLLLYLKAKKIPLSITRRQAGQIILITVCGYGGTTVLLFFAYNYISSGAATTIHFVYPAMVIVYSLVFLKEKVKPLKLICVGLCMAGIWMFRQDGAGAGIEGILLAFASGCTYAFYIVYLDKSDLRQMPPLKLIFYMNFAASAVILSAALATHQFTAELTPYGWFIGTVFAVTVSFIAVLGFQLGVRYTGGQSAAILSTFEPITSVIIGAAVYGEKFSAAGIVGCILILAATILDTRAEALSPSRDCESNGCIQQK